MQEAKQGVEKLSAYEKAGGPHWPTPGSAQERIGPVPCIIAPSRHFSALCPLEGQGVWNISTEPTWPGLPCLLAWKAQGSLGPGSLLGMVGTLRHVEVWLGQRKPDLWY